MDELEEIRKRKLEEMQARQVAGNQEEAQIQQELQQLEIAVKGRMSKEALQRYGNIKAADNEKAVQLLLILGQLLQSGRVSSIDDKTLKQVLLQATPKKKDFKITRK